MKFTSIDLDVHELLSWEKCIESICEAEGCEPVVGTTLYPSDESPLIKTTGELLQKWKLVNVRIRTSHEDEFGLAHSLSMSSKDLYFCSDKEETVRTEITFLVMARPRIVESWLVVERDINRMGQAHELKGYEHGFKTSIGAHFRRLATFFMLNDTDKLRAPFGLDEALSAFDDIRRLKAASIVTRGLMHAHERVQSRQSKAPATERLLAVMTKQIIESVSKLDERFASDAAAGDWRGAKRLLAQAYDVLEAKLDMSVNELQVKHMGEHLRPPEFKIDIDPASILGRSASDGRLDSLGAFANVQRAPNESDVEFKEQLKLALLVAGQHQPGATKLPARPMLPAGAMPAPKPLGDRIKRLIKGGT